MSEIIPSISLAERLAVRFMPEKHQKAMTIFLDTAENHRQKRKAKIPDYDQYDPLARQKLTEFIVILFHPGIGMTNIVSLHANVVDQLLLAGTDGEYLEEYKPPFKVPRKYYPSTKLYGTTPN